MIMGVGVDIVEIPRIEKALCRNANFLNKLLSNNEIEFLRDKKVRPEYVAGRFAAKEAVSKALGTGFRKFKFKDIEIENTSLGKPIVYLKGEAENIVSKLGNYKIHLSISHSRDNAIAYAVLEVEDYENCNSGANEESR